MFEFKQEACKCSLFVDFSIYRVDEASKSGGMVLQVHVFKRQWLFCRRLQFTLRDYFAVSCL